MAATAPQSKVASVASRHSENLGTCTVTFGELR